jgi:hypothetical protein
MNDRLVGQCHFDRDYVGRIGKQTGCSGGGIAVPDNGH